MQLENLVRCLLGEQYSHHSSSAWLSVPAHLERGVDFGKDEATCGTLSTTSSSRHAARTAPDKHAHASCIAQAAPVSFF